MSLGPEEQEQPSNGFILNIYLPEETCSQILERSEQLKKAIGNHTNNDQDTIQFSAEFMRINRETLPQRGANLPLQGDTIADQTQGYVCISLKIRDPNFSLEDLENSLKEDYIGVDYIGEFKRRILDILNVTGLEQQGACQGCTLNPVDCPTQIGDMQRIISPQRDAENGFPVYAIILTNNTRANGIVNV